MANLKTDAKFDIRELSQFNQNLVDDEKERKELGIQHQSIIDRLIHKAIHWWNFSPPDPIHDLAEGVLIYWIEQTTKVMANEMEMNIQAELIERLKKI